MGSLTRNACVCKLQGTGWPGPTEGDKATNVEPSSAEGNKARDVEDVDVEYVEPSSAEGDRARDVEPSARDVEASSTEG